MPPMPGILNTARTLALYTRMQEVVANNIANANTPGFKADRLSATLFGGSTPVPVRSVDLEQGALRETGRSLDFALDGKGFLVVDTPQGERLVRGGSFKLDGEGRLADADGHLVLGEDGPIVIAGGAINIEADGSVQAGGNLMGRLRLVSVSDPGTLQKEAGGRMFSTAPLAKADQARVRQGALEEANLDPVRSMVDLITIQRAYSANLDALKAMDSVLGSITSDVGKV